MTDTTAPRGFTGWHMLATMLTFFAIVVGANVYLSVEAIRTWTGLVVDKSQQAGLDFNDKVQRALAGAVPRKVIIVPDRLVNLVA